MAALHRRMRLKATFAMRKGSKMTLPGKAVREQARTPLACWLTGKERHASDFLLPVFIPVCVRARAGRQRSGFEGRQAIDGRARAASAGGRQPSGPHRTARSARRSASRAPGSGRMRRRGSRHIAGRRRHNLVEWFFLAFALDGKHRHQLHWLQREQCFGIL
jgi:hypothetical protein